MDDVDDGGAWLGWAGSAGLGLALGLGVLYLILRGTAWSPGRGDPVRAVRTHAMITALIALFASGTAGLDRLATAEEYQVFGSGVFPVTTETEGEVTHTITSAPVPALTWVEGLGILLGPVLGFALVYVVAQYTWPRQSGAVRTARLKDRRPADLMPKHLTAFAALVAVATLGMVALSWTAPGVEARQVDEQWRDELGGGGSSWFEPGTRSGEDVAPWLLLAVVLVAVAFAVVLRTVARRPVLGGLHPHDDDLVRRIAVNRALRTAAVMVLGIGTTAVNLYSAARPAPEGVHWPALASLLILFVLLFWRSPHVAELGSHTVPASEEYDAGTSPRASGAPSRPGTARAVLRLRLDGAVLAWIAAVPTGVVAVAALAFTTVAPSDRGGPWALLLWPALPFAAALLILGFTEFGVRRGHSPAEEPSTTGRSSRWPLAALGLALLLATVWSVLCLVARAPQTELGTALAATTAGFALLSLALARLALRRPALGRATAEQDAAIRTGGANRILAVGAAGVFAVTGAALLAGVQVWNGFITSAVLDLGINDLPDGLLLTRGLLLFVLFGLITACLIAPAPRVPAAVRETSRP